MKISELIGLLGNEMCDSGDLEVVLRLDTGQFASAAQIKVMPMFLHDGFEPVYDLKPLARQNKNEHEHVAVLLWGDDGEG